MIRSLTDGERRLARSVFGHAVDPAPVRLIGSPWPFDRAFVPGVIAGRCWIVWPSRALPSDLAQAPLSAQTTFIHELVHVWQAQSGINLLLAKLKAGDGAASYAYPLDAGCDWATLNIEQQASAVEHGFRLSRGQHAPADAAFYQRLCSFAGSCFSNDAL